MKTRRQAKILELIQRNDVETQEELSAYLVRQKYAVITDADSGMMEKYARVLREGFISMDLAKNIVVIKTVSGMAGAVCAAIDAMKFQEMVGSIAGDDTIICIIRDDEEAVKIMKKLRKIVGR